MSINFNSGKPIGIYENKKGNKDLIYIDDNINIDKSNLTDEELNNIIEDYISNQKGRISMRQINEIYEALKNNIEPENKKMKELYKEILRGNKKTKIFNIDNNSLFPIFDPEEDRKVFYIAGMSGCGKSTFTSDIIKNYIKIYPKNKVYLFSNKPKDEVLDKHKKLVRIELNNELLDDPLTLDELSDSLVIFDDIEYTPNKQIGIELDRIRDLILQQGRSYKISFCYISHQLTNYKHSRVILNECHCCVLFPKLTTTYALKYLLEKYFGFNKNDIQKLKSLNSRWVCVNKVPPYVLHQNGLYIID
jgi:hypothetical protein